MSGNPGSPAYITYTLKNYIQKKERIDASKRESCRGGKDN